jgi:hypothetical protein
LSKFVILRPGVKPLPSGQSKSPKLSHGDWTGTSAGGGWLAHVFRRGILMSGCGSWRLWRWEPGCGRFSDGLVLFWWGERKPLRPGVFGLAGHRDWLEVLP